MKNIINYSVEFFIDEVLMSCPISVLFVDDEILFLTAGREFLEKSGNFVIDTAELGTEALKKYREKDHDIIISDYKMPDMDGISFLKEIRQISDVPFIFFTGKGREEVVIEAINNGANFYLQKGYNPRVQFTELAHIIVQAVSKRNAEQSLQEALLFNKQIIDEIKAGVVVYGPDSCYLVWNHYMEEFSGIPADQVIGKNPYTEFPYLTNNEVMDAIHQAFSGMTQSVHEILYSFPETDRSGWIEATYSPLLNVSGKIIGVIGKITEISDWRKINRSLLESEEQYRAMFTHITCGVAIYEAIRDGNDFIFKDLNPAAEKISKIDKTQMLGKSILELFPDREEYELFLALKRVYKTGNPEYLPATYLIDSSSEGWRENYIYRLPCGNIVTIYNDVTERELASRELKDREEFVRTVIDNLPEFIIVYDTSGTIIYANPMVTRVMKMSPEQVIGTHIISYIAPDFQSTITESSFSGEHIDPHEILLKMPDNRLIPSLIKGTKIVYNKKPAVLLLIMDISERKAVEEDLKKAGKSLEMANKKLNLLNSVTRHDLLNKISVLQLYQDISQKITDNPTIQDQLKKQEEIVGKIQKQIEYTRYYQNIGVHTPKWQDLEMVIQKASSEFFLNQITLDIQFNSIYLYADPLLERVFINLVENTLRHGGIIKNIKISSHEKGGELSIIYIDDGIGINQDQKEEIFNEGYGNNAGFGLFLAREILSITGMSIRETGIYGEGVRFEILIPSGLYQYNSDPITDGNSPIHSWYENNFHQ